MRKKGVNIVLRTNNKQVKERIRQLAIEELKRDDYTGATFEELAPQIARSFIQEVWKYNKRYYNTLLEAFEYWASGDPLTYYYNQSAIDLLGDILEETQEERSKFNQIEAEKMLTRLLYRELDQYIIEALSERG